jgi:HNH endonuclease
MPHGQGEGGNHGINGLDLADRHRGSVHGPASSPHAILGNGQRLPGKPLTMPRFFSNETRRALMRRASASNGIPQCEWLFGFGCGAALRPGKYVYDHIVPYELTRDSTFENAQVLCDNCNGKKTFVCDVPRIAKAKRVEDKHIGAERQSRRPMPCGRNSRRKMKIGGGTEPRMNLSQKMAALREKLGGVYLQPKEE